MRKIIGKILPYVFTGGICFALIFPKLALSANASSLAVENLYPSPTGVIATPYGGNIESLTLIKVYIPLISKTFPPDPTTSWYMETVNTEMLLSLGCQLGNRDRELSGQQDSIVILDFDSPTYTSGVYGANLFGYGPVSTSAVAAAVKFFGAGYYNCVYPDRASTIVIAVGTNNCDSTTCSGAAIDGEYYAHGAAWAVMVNEIGSYFVTNGYYPQVRAYGASDIEVGWNDYYTTRQWVDGYDSINNWPMFNFGDAEGCPQVRTGENSGCANGWYQYTIWYVSGRGGVNSSSPLPLIYAKDGANGRQWYSLSAYGVDLQNGRLELQGAVTQHLACSQRICPPGTNNSPQEGYINLYSALNSDPDTSQPLKWSTDIGYSGW
ncbi:MAG: hypothetical protein M5U05_04355 [Anaerolineales bacterium]|jgi:hypothetical protein|nr:hypothetical protein [Anaerolineales bacterium]